jgi:8-amino-7-oxononanoate synthase
MSVGFEDELLRRLADLESAGLRRELRELTSPAGVTTMWRGRALHNFSGNDYLGLATHGALVEAAQRAARDFGAGSGASRLICGSLAVHHALEDRIAEWKRTPAALAFSTGYAAALGAITALVGNGDIVIVDKLVHACCVDAARLSGARLRVFAHNDLAELEAILQWAATHRNGGQVLIVTESVFSMDGDTAPLRELVELKDRFGAWLMVDEAHAAGVLGPQGGGLIAAAGLRNRVEVHMGTLGKAIGAAGGFIAGSRPLIDLLIHRARSFIFSTAPVPAAAGAALAGVEIARSAEGDALRACLQNRITELCDAAPIVRPGAGPGRPAILPLLLGPEDAAVRAATLLRDAGFLVPAIRYPTVARGAARLRITLSAAHSPGAVQEFAAALGRLNPSADPTAGT